MRDWRNSQKNLVKASSPLVQKKNLKQEEEKEGRVWFASYIIL
jgi:hypothetical protein